MPRLSLRIKLIASFILILLPILGLLIYGAREANEGRVRTILDDQMQTAQAVAALVDASFDEAFALAWAITDDPLVYTFDPAKLDRLLEPVINHYPQFEAIGIVNSVGDNVGTSAPFPAGIERLGLTRDRPYFQKLMATGEPVVSGVLISRRTLRPTIIVAVPLRGDDGQTAGAVVVTIMLEALARRLDGVALGWEQRILLVDNTGTMAFYTAIKDFPVEQRDLSEFGPIKEALEGRPTRDRGLIVPLLNDVSLAAFTRTSKYGWVVGVTVREDVALAPVRTALRDQFLGFAVVAILSVFLALIASRSFLGPIRRLGDHARALGRGDLAHRARISTGDELEELGKSFDDMAERLQRSMQESLALGEVAEALVRERTLGGVAEVVVEQGQKSLKTDTVALFLANVQREELELIAQRGLSAQTVAEIGVIPFGAATQTSLAARTGQLQIASDTRSLSPEVSTTRRLAEREGQQSMLSQPLFAKGQLVGVLTGSTAVYHRLTPRELEFLRAFAGLCAVAVENARLYEEVRETLHIRDEFLSVAAHEMKTPITSLRGYAQVLLRSKEARPPDERLALEVIERQTKRVTRLAEDLLETVSPSARAPEVQSVDLASLAEEAIHEAEQASERHQVMLCRPGPVVVRAEPELVRRALITLLDNAIRFSPQGGRIEVSVTAEGDMALVSVRDHGLGIPKERQRHVFEPFYEPFPAGSLGYYGATGLGLYLVRTIVERHGGRVWFESEEGRGTVFYFSLSLSGSSG